MEGFWGLRRPPVMTSVTSALPFPALTPSFGVIVPICNPGPGWTRWLDALGEPDWVASHLLVVDSRSTDGAADLARSRGIEVLTVERVDFNHGGTRQRAFEHWGNRFEALIFLTQDAYPVEPADLGRLASALNDPEVGAAYGRQLPHADATPLAAHARQFNYPEHSHTVRLADRARLGIKACFMSNSFAIYRCRDLATVGGFPQDVILGEDMCVGARLLLAGRALRYEAGARVHHSHNYRHAEELRRYFDIGALHAREGWLLRHFGSPQGEGLRFVMSELRALRPHGPSWLLTSLVRSGLKWLGYRLGRGHRRLPTWLQAACSQMPGFWLHGPGRR